MPATRPSRTHTSSSDKLDKLDLSRASPTTNNPTIPNNLTNDSGSATLGVGGVGKGKRQPLKRSAGSAGSGTGSGSGQSLLGFSSRKAGPVTPEKKKTSGLKRRIGEVVVDLESQEDGSTIGPKVPITNTNIHPVFAVPERPTNSTITSTLTIPETTITTTTTTTTLSTTDETVQGISGVPQNGAWDPLLLSRTNPTKEMENNLAPPPPSLLSRSRAGLSHGQDLEPTEEERMEEQVDDDDADNGVSRTRTRTRTINGLAVRKAMIRADEKIRHLRSQSQKQSHRPFSSLSMPTTTPTSTKSKTAVGGKNKVGGSTARSVKGKNNKKMEEEEEEVKTATLDPDDRRWNRVYEAAWELMGGDDVAPSTWWWFSFPFLSAFPPRFTFFTFGSLFGQSEEPLR
ncbi:hypothetical protein QFC24_006609 [Naganishia onofrii]|uniref:Uncharacterized protein n=1 Tax=Naganishia onofrii TaxID=1851511 RepID=A0ACC2X0A4_9TREE|nr:hypothetical protein QFC24_006609 [Naganishia onofrii]